jgi:hypothetical protein
MQLRNNRDMQAYPNNNGAGRSSNTRRWVIVFVVALVFIFGAIFIISKGSNGSRNFPQADQEHSTVFEGMSSFIKSGLTTDQVNNLTKEFSSFSPKAKTVSIDTQSLTPGPHDPNKINPFTINFKLTIDSKPYTGTVIYFDLSSVRLILYNSSGKQVFDSGNNSPQE